MNALCLRKVDPLLAQVSRELGAGQCLSFSAQGQQAELTLLPLIASDETPAKGVWLNTAVGALCLSDAEALLSLLGDIP
ncbi:Type III secretion protein HrcQa [Pseudomonas syringae pv. spinaceae]|uniref:Type III secretion protein HrcQa n=2 Tax=Pseudomonas syringae TaxID=317 RepID=A0A0Q0BQ81_PSESX|nr:Type III secretion protein HrcQa [Pseudomonas syringae pv. spinaceae]